MFPRVIAAATLLPLMTLPALAHVDPVAHGSFGAGFVHPFSGLDHLLAMVAVGLWAYHAGGRALWIVPGAFVGTMLAGFLLALSGVPLPFVEPVIAASVIALGLAVAMALRLPVMPGAAIVAMFALFHGYAHGGEIGAASAASYAAGFAGATALLHAAGLASGWLVGALMGSQSRGSALVTRALGAVVAVAGLGIIAG